ncbi:MAG: efflux RND transporter permease subunit [Planctomycetota bacterium]
MSTLFFRRPRLTVLVLALILVAGFSALEVLPRREDPELTSRNALVVTRFPGATAERVERLVTEKLEQELFEVEEVKELTSTSSAGVSVVSIELRDDVLEPDEIWSRVRDRVDDAALAFPAGALAPAFERMEITAWTMLAGLAWRRDDPAPLGVLGRLADELEDRLRALPGTEEAEVFGAPAEEIRVEIDPARLAALGLSAEALAGELAAADSKVAAGRLLSAQSDLLLEVDGELDSVARIAAVPVRAGADGALLRVGDVARVERGVRDPADELALISGSPGVAVAARLRSDARVDRGAARARAEVEAFAAELEGDVEVALLFDQSRYTDERLRELLANLGLGTALVVLVLLIAMGWRSALLVGSALPLSALMVLAGMRLLGVPIHQMSVTGLIIALGLLIDNAIVMVDETRHRLAEASHPAEAVGRAVRALAVPLLGSTLTTVLAFLPLVIAPGPVGEFVGAMSLSVVLAIVSSFALALTVLPALTAWLERLAPAERGPRFLHRGIHSARLERAWRAALGLLVRRPALGVAAGVALPLAGFVGGSGLQEQFFPPAGRDQAQVELRLGELASIDSTYATVERAYDALLAHPRVADVHWFVGGSAPKFYYNMLEAERGSARYAQGLIQLDDKEGATAVLRELQDLLDRSLPGAQVLVKQLEQGPPFEAPIELRLEGEDVELLRELGEELRAELAAVEGVVHTRATLGAERPKLRFAPADEDLRLAGLDRVALADRLAAALDGALGGSVVEGDEELPVRVRVEDDSRATLDAIASLELAGAGGWTPLSALGELTLAPELGSLPHRNGRRVNTVQGFLTAGTLPQDALDTVRARIAERRDALPAGITLAFGGESAERDEAVGNLAASVGVLLVLMVATLVLSFQSFRRAALIGLVGVLAVGLSLGSLAFFGHPFGFMAIVGTMGLIGIAINDSIVVLAALVADPRARAGDPAAVVDVVVRSTRHVLATTVTTVAGFLPLLAAGGGLWPPLATAIAGGVGGATLLALTLVPAVHVVTTRWHERASEEGGVATAAPVPTA